MRPLLVTGDLMLWTVVVAVFAVFSAVFFRQRQSVISGVMFAVSAGITLAVAAVSSWKSDDDPTPIPIYSYPLLFAVAGVVCVLLIVRRLSRELIRQPQRREVVAAFVLTIVPAVLLGKLDAWLAGSTFAPTAAIAFGQADQIALNGLLLGGLLGVAVHCRCFQIRLLPFLDIIAPPIMIGIAIVRVGCFLAGCCFGGPCSSFLAVEFPAGSAAFQALAHTEMIDATGDCTVGLHPTQLYSVFSCLAIGLLGSFSYAKRMGDGWIFLTTTMGYAMTRGCIDHLRIDKPTVMHSGLTVAQLQCLLLLTASMILIMRLDPRRQSLQRAVP